jgi:cell division protein FtsL
MTYSQSMQRAAQVRRNQNVGRYLDQRPRLGPFSNALVLLIAITLMGLLYLTQITKTSVYGFEVSELKQEKSSLETQNQNLRVEAARLQSIERIRKSEVAGKLSENERLTFVDTGESSP